MCKVYAPFGREECNVMKFVNKIEEERRGRRYKFKKKKKSAKFDDDVREKIEQVEIENLMFLLKFVGLNYGSLCWK